MKLLLSIFAALVLATAGAEVTNVIDVVSLGHLGTGSSDDGWLVTSVTNYSKDYKYALRFNKKDCAVTSPVYDERIVAVEMKILSSSQSGRHLAFTFADDDPNREDPVFTCPYSPSGKVSTECRYDLPDSSDCRQLSIRLDGGGGSTAWGIVSLSVITGGVPDGFFIILR